MSFSASSSSAKSEINVTPLIDVLLVLLIIFMVITPLKQQGLRAVVPQLPTAAASEPPPQTIVLQVRAGADGSAVYAINQEPVAKQALPSRLQAIFALRQQRQMFVKGDADLSFAAIAEAISMAHQAAVFDIGILTPASERP